MWYPVVSQRVQPIVRSIVRSRGVPSCPAVSCGIDSEIDSETDREIERCPAVSRGVPLSEIDSEIDREIDMCPAATHDVPWCPAVSRGLKSIVGPIESYVDFPPLCPPQPPSRPNGGRIGKARNIQKQYGHALVLYG
eukprot:3420041-Pyramimonas_sp.AAC.1